MSARFALLCLLAVGVMTGGPTPAATKDYAYLLVQGRISDPVARNPMAGATVRLSSPAGTFHAVTDRNGVFTFHKLPVSSYEVHIVDAAGKVVRSARAIDPGDPARSRVVLRMGQREVSGLRLDTQEQRVVLVVPDPPPNWKKFGIESAIFVGIAVLFAL